MDKTDGDKPRLSSTSKRVNHSHAVHLVPRGEIVAGASITSCGCVPPGAFYFLMHQILSLRPTHYRGQILETSIR